MQVSSFLAGMFGSDLIASTLIVLPVSLINTWEKELARWAPDVRVKVRVMAPGAWVRSFSRLYLNSRSNGLYRSFMAAELLSANAIC